MTRRSLIARSAVVALLGSLACSSSGPVTPADAGHDSGGFQVLHDTGAPDATEAGQDAGPDASTDAGFPCTPGPVDLKSFGRHPTPAHTCSPGQLSTLVVACLGSSSTTSTCDAAQGSITEKSCVDCIYTPATASAWGPTLLVSPPGATNLFVPLPNFGGCIAQTDTSPAGQKCALDFQELQECEVAACVSRCRVNGVEDLAGRDALFGTLSGSSLTGGCFQAADATVCSAISNAGDKDCTDAVLDGPSNLCFELGSVPEIEQMFSEYCGGYVEAGPPGDGAPPPDAMAE